MNRLFGYLFNKLPGVDIVSTNGDTILKRRYILNSKYLGIFLHQIVSADEDPNIFHDHPWEWSFSIILSGSYGEEILTEKEDKIFRKISYFNFISKDTFHRIVSVSPSKPITLFVRGKKSKNDGFLIYKNDQWLYLDYQSANLEYASPPNHSPHINR